MSTSTEAVVNQLVKDVPVLRPLLDEHVEENGELLPHVFFGRLTDWLIRSYVASPRAEPDADWRRVLARLERIYETGSEEVRELLYASFLELLPYPNEDGAGISTHLGPSLGADLGDFR